MTLFALFAILLFTPTKAEITADVHNLELQIKFQLVLMCCIPFSVIMFNLKDRPWEFRIKILGKTVGVERIIKTSRKVIAKEPKRFRVEQIRIAKYTMVTMRKYLKSIECCGIVGIKDRADYTAVITQMLNGIFLGIGLVQEIRRLKICFCPEYSMDVMDVHAKGIISVNAANIIHESIRYYWQRRK